MLEYLYTGKLEFSKSSDDKDKQEQVTQIYRVLHKYLLFDGNPDLEEFCLSHYMESLTPESLTIDCMKIISSCNR